MGIGVDVINEKEVMRDIVTPFMGLVHTETIPQIKDSLAAVIDGTLSRFEDKSIPALKVAIVEAVGESLTPPLQRFEDAVNMLADLVGRIHIEFGVRK